LDLNLLTLDDRPAAFAYNYTCRGSVLGLRMGYDPAISAAGPGTVLTRMILEDSLHRGDTVYDFGPGYMECKRNWRTRLVPVYHYTYYPWAAPRLQLLRLRRWLRGRLHPDYVVYGGGMTSEEA
jgi:hypothetical protein